MQRQRLCFDICLCSACEPYVGTALWLLEAEGHVGTVLLGPYYERILLLLIAVIFADTRLKQLSRLVVFRHHHDLGVFLLYCTSAWSIVLFTSTYTHYDAPAEARASVEPVVILELIDLDALAIVGWWRYQGHHPREVSASTRAATGVPSVARNVVATGRAGQRWGARLVLRARCWSSVVCDVRAGRMTIGG